LFGENFDPRLKNTFFLLFGTIVYLVVISFFILFLKKQVNGVEILFALTLLPLLAIFVMVWGYGMKFKMAGLELDYYPVEKVMNAPSTISDSATIEDAENFLDKDKTDLLNILDEHGIFQGILTKSDILKARKNKKLKMNVRNLMTKREKIIHASEREDLRSIMKKIGQSKHSRLPVIDENNHVIGIVDSVNISDALTKILQ
jgi:CBS domain-containing protein